MDHKHVCPWWLCRTFDNPLRRLLHDPGTILAPYIRPGDSVVDVGAGMGYFSIPAAKLVGPLGTVTAIDIQPKMLAALNARAERSGISDRIHTHCAGAESLGFHTAADFVLAFWMLHEVPDQARLLAEIRGMLKPEGMLLVAEPVVHVNAALFAHTLAVARDAGFSVRDTPSIRISRSALLVRSADNG